MGILKLPTVLLCGDCWLKRPNCANMDLSDLWSRFLDGRNRVVKNLPKRTFVMFLRRTPIVVTSRTSNFNHVFFQSQILLGIIIIAIGALVNFVQFKITGKKW